MKRIIFIFSLVLCSVIGHAQPIFDLGLKAGLNNSKVSLDINDYSEESITKMHWGAFARVGVGKVYVQPEVYFTRKGGEFKDVSEMAAEFNYKSVDVPVLLGVKLLDAKAVDLRVMAGPVFSFVTDNDADKFNFLEEQYFKDRYTALQYGVGVDVLFLSLDFRMEHANKVYNSPELEAKNRTFMVTLGFKIL
ncbi:PorT family protein [Maribellus sp. CM-23]|uniref:porin family protein n=1 Tax=Maribellus sp. CM-23 TaxID=2781026 RepID=UPI001F2B03D5|nr:porin family protein [Maribellus sp. CM-23]MCE4562728.1 PorT family protein [Maribellus sp. CM-23]